MYKWSLYFGKCDATVPVGGIFCRRALMQTTPGLWGVARWLVGFCWAILCCKAADSSVFLVDALLVQTTRLWVVGVALCWVEDAVSAKVSIDWLVGWLVDGLIDWLVYWWDCLIGWLVDWLFFWWDYLIGWLIGWLVYWWDYLIGWLVSWLADGLIVYWWDYLIGWLIGRFNGIIWLVDWLIGWLLIGLFDWLIDWMIDHDWLIGWLIDRWDDLIRCVIDWQNICERLIDWSIDWWLIQSYVDVVLTQSRSFWGVERRLKTYMSGISVFLNFYYTRSIKQTKHTP